MGLVNEYQITAEEVISSQLSCVVIDETGNPGQDSGSDYLLSTRKSWAAVILSPMQFVEVANELPEALKELKEITGGDEFHLTDIYRGHKSFKDVKVEQRLGAIKFLAHIFKVGQYPIFFQTLDPISANIFRAHPEFQQKLGALDLRKHEELALWMLLIQVQNFILDPKNSFLTKAFFVIDEGDKWRDSRSIDIQNTVSKPDVFVSKKLFSRNSKGFPAIQLADFAAFCINRQQWLMVQPANKLNKFDIEFLKIISSARLNTINIPKINVNLNTWQSSDYDFLRGVDDESKGISSR